MENYTLREQLIILRDAYLDVVRMPKKREHCHHFNMQVETPLAGKICVISAENGFSINSRVNDIIDSLAPTLITIEACKWSMFWYKPLIGETVLAERNSGFSKKWVVRLENLTEQQKAKMNPCDLDTIVSGFIEETDAIVIN